jgi:hypothetical protein
MVLDMTYSNIDFLTALVEACSISQCEQNTSGRPREFISQWISRVFWSRETSAVRQEAGDLPSLGMYLLDDLDGIKMVQAWIELRHYQHMLQIKKEPKRNPLQFRS